MSDEFDPKRFAWARSKFDVEGIAGAIAAWLVGILLGIVWDPLFWIGAIAAIAILLATRRSNRSGPDTGDAVLAPVDGVVTSVMAVTPPSELRFPGAEATRIRISSSPASQNRVFAPVSGSVQSLIQEQGTESQPIAMDADAHGLFNGYLMLESPEGPVGVRLVTGGLGPRVDFDVQEGDGVEMGRVIAKRRLGGWCDVYLPSGQSIIVGPGMTVVGAETRLTIGEQVAAAVIPEQEMDSAPVDAPEPAPSAAATTATAAAGATAATPPADETPPASDDTPPPVSQSGAGEDDSSQLETLTAEDGQDPSELFAKLRSRVEEANKTGD